MFRRLLVGTVLAIGTLAWGSVSAEAQPACVKCQGYSDKGGSAASLIAKPSVTTRRDGDVTFTIGSQPGESTLRAEGKGVTFIKRLTAERVQVRIAVPGDWFELEAGTTGTVRLSRNGKSTKIQMTAAREEVAKAQQFAAGSKALAGFESLASAIESSARPEALSVMTSFAMLHSVRGTVAPARALAKSIKARQAAGAVRASSAASEEMPYDCWINYAITINQYLYDYAQCYEDYGWIPGMNAVCTFEWGVRSELAWFWLIGCSGGLPAV